MVIDPKLAISKIRENMYKDETQENERSFNQGLLVAICEIQLLMEAEHGQRDSGGEVA